MRHFVVVIGLTKLASRALSSARRRWTAAVEGER
jgi:hypothetical protein